MSDPKHIPAVKPVVTGPVDSNIFFVMGVAARALKHAKLPEAAKEMHERIMSSGSYDAALTIAQEYVDFDL